MMRSGVEIPGVCTFGSYFDNLFIISGIVRHFSKEVKEMRKYGRNLQI